MKRAACTIVSANYLHFAWTLAESFLQQHPGDEFHLLLVDRVPQNFVARDSRVHILEVEKLGLLHFDSLAFKYDILELNTAVKPTFLKYLCGLGLTKVLYFDPDIYIFKQVEMLFDALEDSSVLLTPHILSPTLDAEHVCEKDLMGTGVFNLGFIGVSNSVQGLEFLHWWEERCLAHCFQDLRSGLFVDQKWVNLAPCLFDRIQIMRHPGCNVAYWNLPERLIEETAGTYSAQMGRTALRAPLIFFHYSGYRLSAPNRLSAKLRVPVDINEALARLLVFYGERLRANGAEQYEKHSYSYQSYSDGQPVTTLARRLYAATLERWTGENPFLVESRFFKAARRAGLFSTTDLSVRYSSNNFPAGDWRVKAFNRFLFSLLKIIGADRYTMLMKYLSYISILRNQAQLLTRVLEGTASAGSRSKEAAD